MKITLSFFGVLSFIGLALAGEATKGEQDASPWKDDPLYYPGVKISSSNRDDRNATYAGAFAAANDDATEFNKKKWKFSPLYRQYASSDCGARERELSRGGYYYVTEEEALVKSCTAVSSLAENVGVEICCSWQGESCTYKKGTSVSISKGGSTKFGISVSLEGDFAIGKTTVTASFEQEFRYDKTVTEVTEMELKCPPGKCCRPQLTYLTLKCDFKSYKTPYAFEKLDMKAGSPTFSRQTSSEYNSQIWHEDWRKQGHYIFDYLHDCGGVFYYATYYNTVWRGDSKETLEGKREFPMDPNTAPSTLYLRLRDGSEREVGVKPQASIGKP
ncbi:hypothetical protein BGW38_003664 [Lunasporangiospora selenospora]|uniref:Uncharacterized protein n=1 Tax=Lunasporangiospora selenospora TaxID=979761 RepID=A0A9P6G2J0_9FUNG|nr:hypothetical protein BGW38_003664 [Lunasporangiospora selenospora]